MGKAMRCGIALMGCLVCLAACGGTSPFVDPPREGSGFDLSDLPVRYDFSLSRVSMPRRLGERWTPALPEGALKKTPESPAIFAYWVEPYFDYDMAGQVVSVINRYRREAGLAELSASSGLSGAAAVRAAEIVGFYSHTRPSGAAFYTAYTGDNIFGALGENLVRGYSSAEDIMAAFMGSEGHRNNILGDFTHVGVSVYRAGNGKYHCAQMFGKTHGSTPVGEAPLPAEAAEEENTSSH